MQIEMREMKISLDANTMVLTVDAPGGRWQTRDAGATWVQWDTPEGVRRTPLAKAQKITTWLVQTGSGQGLCTRYENFPDEPTFVLETVWWLETGTGHLYAWAVPLAESRTRLQKLAWPAPFVFDSCDARDVTVYPLMQGMLLPNGWEQEFDLDDHWELESDHVYTRSAYMPWWGQLRGRAGYMALAVTPWDAGFSLCHPSGGATSVQVLWNASLGQLSYGRAMRFSFFEDGDYVTLCKAYRDWLKEQGELVTLKEKMQRNPKAEELRGTAVIHTGIWQEVKPSCRFAAVENPETVFVPYFSTFEQRAEQLCRLKARGLTRAYLHVDGWGQAGYDSQHPDVLPPAEKAGGWEGFAGLRDTAHELGYLFALHDQYRDYYMDAPSYRPELAIHDGDGKIPTSDLWVGGTQAFLCPSQYLGFLRRNYGALQCKGMMPDGVYLDVFACVALDECWEPHHPVTRRQCMEYREQCFNWMRSHGVIVSSEEGIGWAMRGLDLVHHANYALVCTPQEGTLTGHCTRKPYGIPVPLLNLVYHDCVVTPWFITEKTDESPEEQNGFLHALLNGGVPYVDIDASAEEIRRAAIVSELHKRLGTVEMTHHRFLEGQNRQETEYADGTCVQVDFTTNEYKIYSKAEVLNGET